MLTSFYTKHRDTDTLRKFLDGLAQAPVSTTQYECTSCHLASEHMRWHCPRCNAFDSFSTHHVL